VVAVTHTFIDSGAGVPASSGAYSPAVVAGTLCFVSGQSPVDPETGEVIEGSLADQVNQTLDNVFSILRAAGFSEDNLVSVTIMLADLADREEVNAVYERRLRTRPARMMVEAGAVPPAGARLEIQAIAARQDRADSTDQGT
jgi:2-iminobutanoate/2-iminopropanoate deaminase